MTKKNTRFDVNLLLPGVPDSRDACFRRMSDLLEARTGVEAAHLVERSDGRPGQLCVHFDPEIISFQDVRRTAQQAGATLQEKYGHLLRDTAPMRPGQAKRLTLELSQPTGVLEATVFPHGVAAKLREDRVAATAPNECWAMDFMVDQLFDGRKLRVLTIVDICTKLCPAIGAAHAYKGHDVAATLEAAAREHGRPKRIRVDNGPEFVSRDLDLWAWLHGVVLDYSRPGKPTDNAFAEGFNSRVRQECLNAFWFLSLADAR